jgi:hypothetical protein
MLWSACQQDGLYAGLQWYGEACWDADQGAAIVNVPVRVLVSVFQGLVHLGYALVVVQPCSPRQPGMALPTDCS